jgi:hypothetical protein
MTAHAVAARHQPLIVIGYGGTEPSIMRHLLIEQAAETDEFSRGMCWCTVSTSEPGELHGSLYREMLA